ncbi:metallophosphoesterase family protein [Enterococcus olivae]
MPIKPVSGEIQSQVINDNLSYLDSKKIEISQAGESLKEAMTGGAIPYVGGQTVDMGKFNSDIQSDIGEWQEVVFTTNPGRWNNDGTELNSEAALADYLRTEIPVISGSIIRLQYDVNLNKHFVFLDGDNNVVSNQNHTTWGTTINIPDKSAKVRIDYRKDAAKIPHYYVLSYLPIATKKEIVENIQEYQNDFKISGELPNKSVGLYNLTKEIQEDIYDTEEMSSTWVVGGWLANGNADNGTYATANYLRTEYIIPEIEQGQSIVLKCRQASNTKEIYEIGEDNTVINTILFTSDASERFLIAPMNQTKSLKIRVSNNVDPKLARPMYGGIASKKFVQNALKEVDIDSIPDYWQEHMDLKVAEINEKMRTINGDAYIFLTDTHWRHNDKISPRLIDYLIKHTRVRKVFFGGDIIPAFGTHEQMIDEANDFFKSFSHLNNQHQFFPVTGNHDFTIREESGSPNGSTLSIREQHNYFSQPTDNYIDFPSEKLYYFTDNRNKKIRYVFINQHERVTDTEAYWSLEFYVSQEQIDWLINKALNVEEDWKIVVIGHVPVVPEMRSYQSAFDILKDIFEAYNSRLSLNASYADKTVNHDFSDRHGEIILYQCGHNHRDQFHESDTMLYLSTGCDARYDDDSWDRIRETDSEQLFDVVIIDKNNSIETVRIGAGEDRIFEGT